jgi:hypothetical protein
MKWILGLVTGGNPLTLIIVAGVLMAIGASGGVTVTRWWASSQVAAAERKTSDKQKELDDYQVMAAAVITARLQADADRTKADQVKVNDISTRVEEGKRETEKKFEPVLEELTDLRVAAAAWRLRDAEAARNRGTRAPEDAGSSQRRADACEDRLRGARGAFEGVVTAAEEVARSGLDAGNQYKQLAGAIEHIHQVCDK